MRGVPATRQMLRDTGYATRSAPFGGGTEGGTLSRGLQFECKVCILGEITKISFQIGIGFSSCFKLKEALALLNGLLFCFANRASVMGAADGKGAA